MKSPKLLCLYIFTALLTCSSLRAQDLFDSLRTNQYANFLYQSGSFAEAIDELERYIFVFGGDDVTKYRLIASYRKAGLPDLALSRMRQLWNAPHSVSPAIAREYFGLRILNNDKEQLFSSIEQNPLLQSDDRVFLLSTVMLLNGDFQPARELLDDGMVRSNFTLKSYQTLANEGLLIRHRNPWVSGTLSALLPGAGKVYCGQWQDGLIAFLMVGAAALQSYRGFSRNGVESVYGWVFGALGAGFYIGNITGSVKSAYRYNTIRNERLRSRVQTIFNDNL